MASKTGSAARVSKLKTSGASIEKKTNPKKVTNFKARVLPNRNIRSLLNGVAEGASSKAAKSSESDNSKESDKSSDQDSASERCEKLKRKFNSSEEEYDSKSEYEDNRRPNNRKKKKMGDEYKKAFDDNKKSMDRISQQLQGLSRIEENTKQCNERLTTMEHRGDQFEKEVRGLKIGIEGLKENGKEEARKNNMRLSVVEQAIAKLEKAGLQTNHTAKKGQNVKGWLP